MGQGEMCNQKYKYLRLTMDLIQDKSLANKDFDSACKSTYSICLHDSLVVSSGCFYLPNEWEMQPDHVHTSKQKAKPLTVVE